MNDAKSMLMMYSYAAMKAAEDKAEEKAEEKAKETKAANVYKQTKEVKTKQRGKKNDKGTEGRDSTVTKE